MEKIYYQAQFSEDGKNWIAFNAEHKYDVRESYEEIREFYDYMIKYHNNTRIKHHRIVKFTVESEVIDNE